MGKRFYTKYENIQEWGSIPFQCLMKMEKSVCSPIRIRLLQWFNSQRKENDYDREIVATTIFLFDLYISKIVSLQLDDLEIQYAFNGAYNIAGKFHSREIFYQIPQKILSFKKVVAYQLKMLKTLDFRINPTTYALILNELTILWNVFALGQNYLHCYNLKGHKSIQGRYNCLYMYDYLQRIFLCLKCYKYSILNLTFQVFTIFLFLDYVKHQYKNYFPIFPTEQNVKRCKAYTFFNFFTILRMFVSSLERRSRSSKNLLKNLDERMQILKFVKQFQAKMRVRDLSLEENKKQKKVIDVDHISSIQKICQYLINNIRKYDRVRRQEVAKKKNIKFFQKNKVEENNIEQNRIVQTKIQEPRHEQNIRVYPNRKKKKQSIIVVDLQQNRQENNEKVAEQKVFHRQIEQGQICDSDLQVNFRQREAVQSWNVKQEIEQRLVIEQSTGEKNPDLQKKMRITKIEQNIKIQYELQEGQIVDQDFNVIDY